MIRFPSCGWLMVVLALAGCAHPAVKLTTQPVGGDVPYAFNGRVAITHQEEHQSAGLRWLSAQGEEDVLLLAPLGQTVAHIHRSRTEVMLEAAGRQYVAKDATELTHRVLGWELPLSGLRSWVRALPAEGEVTELQRDAYGRLALLRQDGWQIEYSRYTGESADSLPLRFTLQREHLKIKVVIDEWETP